MCGCRRLKQGFSVMACALESRIVILWRVISVKLNNGKKITGLEIMTPNHEKI